MKTHIARVSLLCTFFILYHCGFSQVLVPKKCYLHLQGNMNKELSIEMNLVKITDTIYGGFSFTGSSGTINMNFPEGSVIAFVGTIDSKGNIIFYDPADSKGFLFKGRFVTTQSIAGTFEALRGDKRFPFEFREQYSDGSIPLNIFYQTGSTQIVKKPKAPSAHIELALLLPGESSNILFSDTVKKILISRFTGKPSRNLNPDMVLNGIRQVYFENYISTNESIYKEGMGQSFAWESLKFTHVILNKHNLLAFYVENYAFTGGAHGMQTREYTVVNLKNGKIVTLKDLFRTGFEEVLTEILTRKAMKAGGIEQGHSLKDAGYFVEEIAPNTNFYLTPGGIGFFYNHYEIAPYSYGPENFFISFDELDKILYKEGVLKDLMK